MLCYFENMKAFFTKKRIILSVVIAVTFIAMIVLLFCPIGANSNECSAIMNGRLTRFSFPPGKTVKSALTSPFTIYSAFDGIPFLTYQTIVFALLFAAFVTCTVLFVRDVLKQYPIKRRPTKRQVMQAQIDALQAQVDELKKDRADK